MGKLEMAKFAGTQGRGKLETAGRFDLHVHSQYSPCALGGSVSPKNLVRQARRRGLAGFAVTDHDSTRAFRELRALQKQERQLLIVFGEEVRIMEGQRLVGELLVYFVQERVEPGALAEVLDKVHCQGAIASVAHPFDELKNDFKNVRDIKRADAVEVFNARAHSDAANQDALRFAEENKMPFTAGSDSHSLPEVGKAGVECSAADEGELRKAILKRECRVFGKRHGLLEKGYAKAHQMLWEKGFGV